MTRRRARSLRVSLATGLVVLAALAVAGAVLSGSHPAVAVAAGGAVLLGAAATRLVHLELLDSRVEAARDRAEQAKGYVAITEARIAEQATFTRRLEARIRTHEQAIADLEGALTAAHQRAADAMKQRADATRNADEWLAEAEQRLEDAEGRAAEAILRVHELELELDAARAELAAVPGLGNRRSA
ncbi:hypothetical protein [Nocardioides sp. Kera G14]|uniref:hypothetical protein n=1 Tax=Nocardioides sp. Kera G14 TaxID=2884264 RepID=UPI001D12A3AB|nr:hypothetical protein [Nocardioides sp. Kera G14]UDY23849.1 hypothetical protein LH076_00700 [Nocardioides sp. Kera G14]